MLIRDFCTKNHNFEPETALFKSVNNPGRFATFSKKPGKSCGSEQERSSQAYDVAGIANGLSYRDSN